MCGRVLNGRVLTNTITIGNAPSILIVACALTVFLTEVVAHAAPPIETTPLVRFYNRQTNEHCYSHLQRELGEWRNVSHVKEHYTLGLVASKQLPGTVPLVRLVRKTDGRHFYKLEAMGPARLYDVDKVNFSVYVWTEPGDGRIPVYCSTWIDKSDIYFDIHIHNVEKFSANSKANLNVDRLRPTTGPMFYIYPASGTPLPESIAQSVPIPGAEAKATSELSESGKTKRRTNDVPPAIEAAKDLTALSALNLASPATSFDMTEDGKFLVISHQASNSVSVYDVLKGEVVAEVACSAPRSVLCRGAHAYIANFGEGNITVLSRDKNWNLQDKLRVPKLNIMHLEAAQGSNFADELLVTCHGSGSEAARHDGHVYRLNVSTDRASELSKAPVVFVSADGRLAVAQDSYGVRAMNYRQYSQAASQVDQIYRGGSGTSTYIYQVATGSYWFGQDFIMSSAPIEKISDKLGKLIIPDRSQPLFYALDEDQIRAHRLMTTFPEIGSRRVQFPASFADKSDIFQHLQRTRSYMLDHPVAYTHGDQLHLFVLTAKQGVVLRAVLPAFTVNKTATYTSPATTAWASLRSGSKASSIRRETKSGSSDDADLGTAFVPGNVASITAGIAKPARSELGSKLTTNLLKFIPTDKEFRYQWTLPAGSKLELLSEVEGMSITPSAQLRWHPMLEQIGKHELKLRMTSGDQVDIQRLEIEVVDAQLLESLGGDLDKFETAQRLPLEIDDYYLTSSAAGPRMLLLQGDQLSILSGSGHQRQRTFTLPKRYKMVQDRRDYILALATGEDSVLDVIDKASMKVRRSIKLERTDAEIESVSDWTQDPTRPITYVAVRHQNIMPQNSILQVDEVTGKLLPMNIFGSWVTVSADGRRVFTGHKDVFRRGSSFHINPDWNLIEIPRYGNVDILMMWDPRGDGKLLQANVAPGANGFGVRLSPDSQRVIYLSYTGDSKSDGNLIGWNTKDFKTEPVHYPTKGVGSTTELAFHPWLPLLATPGSGSAVVFDEDTGKLLTNKLLVPSNGLGADKVERIHFAPDGKHLLFVCSGSEGRYLRSVNLRLTAEELSAKRREPVAFTEDGPTRLKASRQVNLGELTSLKTPSRSKEMSPKEIGRTYLDAVVTIKTDRGAGSGFFISESGYLLTSAHVIEDAKKISIIHNAATEGKPFEPGESPAELIGADYAKDIALLKIEIKRKPSIVILAKDEAIETGEAVIVIGNPGAGKEILTRTMTNGIVSNPDRALEGQRYIQTSAAINPGNSGGAMFDSRGRVIGMVNLKARIEGAAFAIPAQTLRAFLAELSSAGRK